MSIQNEIGITGNCLLNHSTGSSTNRADVNMNNDTPDEVNYICDRSSGDISNGGDEDDYFYTTSDICVFTSNGITRRAAINADFVPSNINISWLPICTTTSMCGASQSYVGGGSTITVNYFGDNFGIFKLHATGTFLPVIPTLTTDAKLGKYWQFTATTNDFIVVTQANIQIQLKFIKTGFYYFPDMAGCSTLLNLGNAGSTSTSFLFKTSHFTSRAAATTNFMSSEMQTLNTSKVNMRTDSKSDTTAMATSDKMTLFKDPTTAMTTTDMMTLFGDPTANVELPISRMVSLIEAQIQVSTTIERHRTILNRTQSVGTVLFAQQTIPFAFRLQMVVRLMFSILLLTHLILKTPFWRAVKRMMKREKTSSFKESTSAPEYSSNK